MKKADAESKLFIFCRKAVSLLIIFSVVFGNFSFSFPKTAYAAASVRQEINIINGIVSAAGDDSAIVTLDTTGYSGATYYFEVVGKVDSGTLTTTLQRVNTATSDATISVTGTSYARSRSSSFSPPAGVTRYNINLSGGTNPMIKAARIIVIQSSLTATETQIEIGNRETGKSNTSNAALTNPKYWKYDSTKWDGTMTAYAEVSWKTGNQSASSTTYTTAGNYTYRVTASTTLVDVAAWGGGGAGFDGSNSGGGAGGGGGAFASSTLLVVPGTAYSMTVGAGGTGSGQAGADSTFNTTTVVADGGTGGSSVTTGIGTGGSIVNSTGSTLFAGGNGGQGNGTDDGGGGGGGSAGPHGAGGIGANASATAGGGGGGGNGGGNASGITGGTSTNGGVGGNGGNGGVCQAGTANANGGGGSGGADQAGIACTAGAPGGGGGGAETTGPWNGARGQIKLTEFYGFVGVALEEDDGSFGNWTFKAQILNRGVASSTSSSTRSAAFTPTTGRHYRLVASTTNSGFTYEIHNAKIIVDQTSSPTKLEPQYLLANTGFGGSTGLQDFDTYFDPADWSGVNNTYVHQSAGVSAGTGDVKLQSDPNGTPADISGSAITDVVQVEQSSSLTMPGSASTIDVNVTGTGTINASRILVQVTPTPSVFNQAAYRFFATSTPATGETWIPQTAAEANSWRSVTYGNGLFVAVSNNGTNRVMTSLDGIAWTPRAAAEVNSWGSVTYGNGLFVALSSDGTNRVMTSPDGITWTPRSAAAANTWTSVIYGNGKFVAVAQAGTNLVMTSPDGITWTPQTAAQENSWTSVTYGNGLFVAVAQSGTNRVMTSPDGITWTPQAAAEANDWRSVTFGNGRFVAVALFGTNLVMTSPDGITWTPQAATEANYWESVTYGNGLFVAAAYTGTNRVMTSPDGITWAPLSVEANEWRSVTYGNGLFVAVALSGTNRVMTSLYTEGSALANQDTSATLTTTGQKFDLKMALAVDDGDAAASSNYFKLQYAQKSGTCDASFTGETYYDLGSSSPIAYYGNSFFDDGSLATSTNGLTYGGDSIVQQTTEKLSSFTNSTAISTSEAGSWQFNLHDNGAPAGTSYCLRGVKTDETSWTDRNVTSAKYWYSVAYGNGLFVAVNGNISATAAVMTSPDGITWTDRNVPSAKAWRSVTYGNGLFVAVNNDNSATAAVMTSPDGITWTDRNVPSAKYWRSVTYGNGLFVAVNESGSATAAVMTSPDGITWTNRNVTSGKSWGSITYGNGLFVAVNYDGLATAAVMTSPDGINWTDRNVTSAKAWLGVTYGNGLFVAVNGSNSATAAVMTSPDGINWTDRNVTSAKSWQSVTYGNGLFVAVNNTGLATAAVMTSGFSLLDTYTVIPEITTYTSVTTTLGDGTDPSNSTIAPAGSITEIDRFSLVAESGTDTVTAATVTLAPANAYLNIATVEIQSIGGSTYCSLTPGSNTVNLTSCGIPVTTTPTEFKVMITPKTHANMPAPATGASYDTTATVTAFTSTNSQSGSDTDSATITVDNLSPANVTSATATHGNELNTFAWTNPADADLSTIMVVASTSAISFVPVEGTTYSTSTLSGQSRIACYGLQTSCTDSSLTNGTAYYYKIFTLDTRGNWSDAGVTPTGSPATPLGAQFTQAAYRFFASSTAATGTPWVARSASEESGWLSVAYGNGIFVAVASSGTNQVMTSPDGTTWTSRVEAEANSWVSVTYGNGLFVAVAQTGTNRVMTSPDGITWTARAAAEANSWNSVTYDNGLFVAVAGDGTNQVMTSPDGITWTARAAAEASIWYSVTYGNGLFVAVAYAGTNRVMTSPDGITWTARTVEESGWTSVKYGNGLFVAVAYDGTNRVTTSPDGITWTSRSASEANQWRAITYGNGLFVAVAANGTNRVMTSPNGITWTAQAAAEANSWRSIIYGNGFFVAVTFFGTNRVMTSDFTSGTALASQDTAASLTTPGQAFRLKQLIAVDEANLAATSTYFKLQYAQKSGTCDASFTGETYADIGSSTPIAFYGNDFTDNGSLISTASDLTDGGRTVVNQTYNKLNSFTNSRSTIANGQDGKWEFGLYDNGATPETSYCIRTVKTDETSWTARAAAEANSWSSVAYGKGLFVAVSSSGTNRVMTSPDGIAWTPRSAPEANNWYSVTYGNGLFVAVAYSGTNRVMTSPDGITWTARAAAEANQWWSVTYGNGLFVSVAQDGTNRVMTSPDGITWTARAATEANQWFSVTYSNGLFVAVANTGTNRVMTSPDGITWTARAAAEASGWSSVTYGNGLFVAVAEFGTNRVMTSPDGITWTARAAAAANAWWSVSYGNGLFVAVAYDGTNRVMTSPDGITWTSQAAAEANSWYSVTYGNGLFVSVAQDGTNRVMTSGFSLLDTYTVIPEIITSAGAAPAAISQTHYRFRFDNGDETGASYIAAQDTAVSANVVPGDRIRLRILVANSGGSATSYTYKLEQSSGACSAWSSVPAYGANTSENWAADYSTYITDEQASTDLSSLANPDGYSFTQGRLKTSGNQTSAITLEGNAFTELEYTIKSTSNAAVGTQYCFRVTNAGSANLFTYSAQPTITLSSVANRPNNPGGGRGLEGDNDGFGPARSGGSQNNGGGGAGGEGSGGGEIIEGGGSGGGGGDSGFIFDGRPFAYVIMRPLGSILGFIIEVGNMPRKTLKDLTLTRR